MQVQKRSTGAVRELEHLVYKVRSTALALFSLRREGESSCNLRPPKLQAQERQTLLGGAQQRDERQQLPVTARDIPTESGKKIFQYKGDQALAQTTQRSCVLFAL